MREKDTKVAQFSRRRFPVVGLIMFGIVFLYVLFRLVEYANKEELEIYEISDSGTAKFAEKKAFVLREESLIYSQKDGYVRYYIPENGKTSKNGKLCSITESTDIYSLYSDSIGGICMEGKDLRSIKDDILSFRTEFNDCEYQTAGSMNEKIRNTVNLCMDEKLSASMNNLIDLTGTDIEFTYTYAPESGIVSFYTDEFSGITKENITNSVFENNEQTLTNRRTTEKVSVGSALMRLVTSDEWQLAVPLTNDEFAELSGNEKLSITVLKDGRELNGHASFMKASGTNYVVIELSEHMISYINDRMLDISIKTAENNGLRVPKTSITSKGFYKIPAEYIRTDESGKNILRIVKFDEKDGSRKIEELHTDVFYKDTEYALIDREYVESGTNIVVNVNDDPYIISTVEIVEGAYQVNKGYCVFVRTEKVASTDEYFIIDPETKNGLRLYDHIALNASKAEGMSIIY